MNGITIVWIALQTVGLAFSFWIYLDCLRDVRLARNQSERLQIVAKGHAGRALNRLLIFALWLVVGLIIGLVNLPPHWAGTVLLIALFGNSLLLLGNSILDRLERRKLLG